MKVFIVMEKLLEWFTVIKLRTNGQTRLILLNKRKNKNLLRAPLLITHELIE